MPFVLILWAVGGALIFFGLKRQKRSVIIEQTKLTTSNTLSDGQYAAVQGTVEKDEEVLTAPVSSQECVYYKVKTKSDSSSSSSSSLLSRRSKRVSFLVKDEQGTTKVDPTSATFLSLSDLLSGIRLGNKEEVMAEVKEQALKYLARVSDKKYVEKGIKLGDDVTAIGLYQSGQIQKGEKGLFVGVGTVGDLLAVNKKTVLILFILGGIFVVVGVAVMISMLT